MCPQIPRYWASDIMSVGRSTRIKNSAATTSLNHNRDPRAVVNLSEDCCAWTWNTRSPYLKCLDHVRMPRLWSFTPIWMEVGAIWGCWDGKKVAATGGSSSWWDENVQNSKHSFVLACTKRPLAPNTLMVDNDRQPFTRVANCTSL